MHLSLPSSLLALSFALTLCAAEATAQDEGARDTSAQQAASPTAGAATAANAGALSSKLDRLVESVPTEILAGKDSYRQSVSYDDAAPYRLTVALEEDGGRGGESRAEVNLGLIARARTAASKRDRLPVLLATDGVASIQTFEDGEADGYVRDTEILSSGVDNAREIAALLTEILPLAKAAWEADAAVPDDTKALEGYLAERIGTVGDGRDVLEQRLTFGDEGSATLTISGPGNRDAETTYSFRMGDLQYRTLATSSRGDVVTLTADTRKGRGFIREVTADRSGFEDELELRFPDYDKALLSARALEKLIPIATAAAEKRLPTFADTAAAFQELKTVAGRTEVENVKQHLTGGCVANLEVTESEDEVTKTNYGFDFADLEASTIAITPSRGAVLVEAGTKNRQDFVLSTEEGEDGRYTDKLTLRFADPVAAERAQLAVVTLAKTCPTAPAAPSLSATLALATARDIHGENNQQTFTQAGSGDCAVQLTLVETGRKSAEETVSTFNLSDLDPRSAEINVRSTTVSVTYSTVKREEIIKTLDNGADQRFTDAINFLLPDVQAAKRFAAGMESAIGGCSK